MRNTEAVTFTRSEPRAFPYDAGRITSAYMVLQKGERIGYVAHCRTTGEWLARRASDQKLWTGCSKTRADAVERGLLKPATVEFDDSYGTFAFVAQAPKEKV